MAQFSQSGEYEFRLHIQGGEHEQLFIVPQGVSIIGRQPGSHLMLADTQISRKHAQLDCSPTACLITDLDSSNGTWVNGEKLAPMAPVALEAGAVIKIGQFEATVERVALTPAPGLEPAALPPAEVLESEAEIPLREPPSPPSARPPSPPGSQAPSPGDGIVPPGLSIYSQRLIDFLPGIYHTDFIARFLGIFEAILMPIEWNIDNFDLFLDPGTAPLGFLPWLENWFALPNGANWSEAQRRTFLKEAHLIYARRGTRWALSRILEIYTGSVPRIIDDDPQIDPYTFQVNIPLRRKDVNPDLIEAIIDANKPAHTTYKLEFRH
jgi:phage tail-like protein